MNQTDPFEQSYRMKSSSSSSSTLSQSVDAGPNESPRTHFFYEHQGERDVDPATLVENGILLWHEEMYTNGMDDLSCLWKLAESLLGESDVPPVYSRIEWLRYQIVMNVIAPPGWSQSKSKTYKGMLISAVYLQEARRLCSEGNTSRVWHILTVAYYFLGINTTPSASRFFAEASAKNHANASVHKRSLVLRILDHLQGDASISSIAKARDAVIEFIEERNELKSEFVELDRLSSSAKHSNENGAMDRLHSTLADWALPNGPYPQMAEAFARFSRKKKGQTSSPELASATGEVFEFDEADAYLRIINVNGDGTSLTLRWSRNEHA